MAHFLSDVDVPGWWVGPSISSLHHPIGPQHPLYPEGEWIRRQVTPNSLPALVWKCHCDTLSLFTWSHLEILSGNTDRSWWPPLNNYFTPSAAGKGSVFSRVVSCLSPGRTCTRDEIAYSTISSLYSRKMKASDEGPVSSRDYKVQFSRAGQ